jgi:ABC-type uncharacterized transport system permease subunit
MALDTTARRRWLGAGTLLAALAMVICGETVLRDRLGPLATVIYWLVCLILTSVAIIIALLDFRALGLRTQREQRDLFEATLKTIQSEVQTKPRPPGGTDSRPG